MVCPRRHRGEMFCRIGSGNRSIRVWPVTSSRFARRMMNPNAGSGTVMPSVLAVLRLMYSSSRRLVSGSARTAECSARRTGPGRGRRARSSPLTFRRFGHTINTDEVFGTHRRRMSSSAPIADMVVRSNTRRPKLRKFASLTSAYAQVAQRTPFDSV